MKIPKRYIPSQLSDKDRTRQRKNIMKSRKLYKSRKYFVRPKVDSFISKPSNHVKTAKQMYSISNVRPSRKLSIKTGCSRKTLEGIVDYHLLHSGCKSTSKALKLATKKCRDKQKCKKYTMKNKGKK